MQGVNKILENINETKQRIGFTRFDRIEKYLKSIEVHKLKVKKDLEIAVEIRELIDYRLNKVKRLYYLNIIFFVGVYFAVFSIFLPSSVISSELGTFLSKLIGLIGTTLFIIAIFISNRIQELYYQDLNLLTSHYISIYSRNETKGTNLRGAISAYHDFVQFFKNKKEDK